MLTKSTIKFIKSLHQKKFRQKYNKFIAETPKIVGELLLSQSYNIEFVCATQTWVDNNKDLLKAKSFQIHLVDNKMLNTFSNLKNPNEVLAVVNIPNSQMELSDLDITPWIIYLDDIQDPGNMGAIIRIADWFNIKTVIKSSGSVDYYNSKVVQSTMGSLFHVQLLESDYQKVKYLGLPSYALSLQGDPINRQILEPGVLIIGNEANGVKKSILDSVNRQLLIPGTGNAESLNAAIACGIACYSVIYGKN